jgi:hypothetical protein
MLRPADVLESTDPEVGETVCCTVRDPVLLLPIIEGTSASAEVHPSPPIIGELPTGRD